MTRDEVVATLDRAFTTDELVDAYVAFGMLKLDEPKSPESRLAKELGWPEGGKSHSELLIALKNAGVALIDDSCRAAK